MHLAVLGGGLAGLTAAALAARTGATVRLYERAATLGGRARTTEIGGAKLNLGPHALYRASEAMRVLRSLGIVPRGGVPPAAGWLDRAGALEPLPATPLALLAPGPLPLRARWELARTLGPGASTARGTVEQWLAPLSPAAREVLLAALRVSTYGNAPARQDAAAAQAQLRRAQGGVVYLDGGWASLVDALRAALPPTVTVEKSEAVELPDADAVIVATHPAHARALGLPVPTLTRVRMSTLDLVLDRLPSPHHRFVLGLDAPTYFSDHGSVAALGGAVVHAARYLGPDDDPAHSRPSVEATLDHAQPGWRDHVRHARWLPDLTVTHRLDEPGLTVPVVHTLDGRRVALAGDWVGERGMLADRSFASAEAAVAWVTATGSPA